jgi:hypothetical protein
MTTFAARAAGVAGFLAMLVAAPWGVLAQPSTTQDLTAVIALQGLPCGRVVEGTRVAETHYVVMCSDGHRYRVLVRDGRVVVERQPAAKRAS